MASALHCLAGLSLALAPLGPPSERTNSTVTAQSGLPLELALRRWPAQTETAKATVVLQHGGGWHSGYFGRLGEALSDAGYEVVALDAIGHGHSQGPKRKEGTAEGLGFWTSIDHVRRDLSKLCKAEKAARPHAPLVLLGESMGVLITAALAEAADPNVDALICAGGLFKMAPSTEPPWIVRWLVRLVGAAAPAKRVTMADLDRTFDSAFGTADWAAAARADPLVSTDSFYLGTMADVLRSMGPVQRRAGRVRVPLLLLHAATDTRTCAAAAKRFFAAAGSQDKTLIVYDQASHQLFQDTEENTARAITDILEWLQGRYGDAEAGKAGGSAATPESCHEESELGEAE